MCKTLQYVFTQCYSYEGEHVPNCKGQMRPVVIELCEDAAAQGYPPHAYVYNYYNIPRCQPVVTETREIHTMCTWHQKIHWNFGGAERPDPFAEAFNRFYIPAGDNDTGSPVLVEDDNYTYHVEGSPWENPWFREVNWNPEARSATLDPPSMSPKDATDYTHPETGVVNTHEHPGKWRSADGRPVVLLDVPEDPPRKNSRWPPYAAAIQPPRPQQPATTQPNGHNPPAQLNPYGSARAPSRENDTSPSTRSTRSSSSSLPYQPPPSQRPAAQQNQVDALVGALSNFGANASNQTAGGNTQGPANGSPSPHSRRRSPSFQPDTPTRSRQPSPAGWQPDSPTKRKRDSEAEGDDESPSKRRHTDSSSSGSTPSSSSPSSRARSHPTPLQSRPRITLRLPNRNGASSQQPRPKITLKITQANNAPGASTKQSRPKLTVKIPKSTAPLPEFLGYASTRGTPPRPSFSTITNSASSPDDDDTPPPAPTTKKPKITLKLRQPKITLKVKQPRVTPRLQLNRAARRGQPQASAPTTYTGPRTRARARAEAEQAQQGPVTRARSRVNAKVKKVNYRV
ncbi:hypothetical protein EDD37DRAFT_669696 [Exophiala viscosa]|uniref:uncharacterized protein n=1 Tax=Exophiala viscosa TaxID=2486360 RepID=UPI0021958B55|nr:hypothetical protein EDD37DRAFT_669696 [Exophiala viscosa]